jgi:hypothetical protein
MGVMEEGGKAVSGVVDAFRSTPAMLAIIIMNIGLMLLLYYYMNRITTRTEVTLKEMYAANDKIYTQWGLVVKDTNALTERALHCILPEDALKLFNARPTPPPPYGSDTMPQAPQAPVRPQNFRRSPVFKDIDTLDIPLFEPMKFPTEEAK